MCFDKAPRDEAAFSGAKDSLAELLYEISTAVHDEEEGDAAEDDMGEAMLDDDDDDDNVAPPPPTHTHTPTHTAPAASCTCVRGCNRAHSGCNPMYPQVEKLFRDAYNNAMAPKAEDDEDEDEE